MLQLHNERQQLRDGINGRQRLRRNPIAGAFPISLQSSPPRTNDIGLGMVTDEAATRNSDAQPVGCQPENADIRLSQAFRLGNQDDVDQGPHAERIDRRILNRARTVRDNAKPLVTLTELSESVSDAGIELAALGIFSPEGRRQFLHCCRIEAELVADDRVDLTLVAMPVGVKLRHPADERRCVWFRNEMDEVSNLTAENLRDRPVPIEQRAIEIEQNGVNHRNTALSSATKGAERNEWVQCSPS